MAQPVGTYTNPLKKFKLVFLGEQSGMRASKQASPPALPFPILPIHPISLLLTTLSI
jgi:hypothetical protein